MFILKNGESCCAIDPQDRAFLYGDGFFTTIKIQQAKPLLWRWHVKRLEHCARQLHFSLDISQVEFQVQQLLNSQAVQSGILKIIISRGAASRGYLPPIQPPDIYLQLFTDQTKPEISFFATQPIAERAIDTGLLISSLGHVMPALAGLKTLNRMEQVLLRQELANTGWVEGLVADMQNNIIEGVYSNCFFYINKKWYTPSIEHAGIAGVMRAMLLDFMQEKALAHCVMPLPKAAINQIDALFFCNAVTGIVPVKTLAGHMLDLQPVLILAQALEQTFIEQPNWFNAEK